MALNLPKLPKLPFNLPQIHLGPRARMAVRYAGLALFAIIVFVFSVQLSFPYGRVKDKMIEALQDKYDVSIGDVERGFWPGRVYFKNVSIRTRQSKPEEVVTTFYINELELNLGIMAMIGGTISLDMDATIGAGHLEGGIRLGKYGKGDLDMHFEGDSLPGANLPIRAVLGLPMTGKIEFSVSLSLPMEKNKTGRTAYNWQKAKGSFALSCPSGCTFGDGKTKLKPLLKNTRQQLMVQEGIDFGKVTMDSLVAKATIKGGKLTVDKFETKSRDGDLKVDFTMTLEKEFNESMVAGCLRFKASDDLLTREPRTHAAISTTGAERRGDGFFHIRLSDRFKDMKRLNQECGPGTNTNNGEDFGRASRPNLTVMPEPGSGTPQLPPQNEQQPPAMPAVPVMDGGAGSANPPGTPSVVPPAQNEGGEGNARVRSGPPGSGVPGGPGAPPAGSGSAPPAQPEGP